MPFFNCWIPSLVILNLCLSLTAVVTMLKRLHCRQKSWGCRLTLPCLEMHHWLRRLLLETMERLLLTVVCQLRYMYIIVILILSKICHTLYNLHTTLRAESLFLEHQSDSARRVSAYPHNWKNYHYNKKITSSNDGGCHGNVKN